MTTSEQRLNGKVVVVTGAGRGIGAATARLLAARGARLALGARSADELRAVADSIGGDVALTSRRDEMAMPPEAIAEAVAYAIGQPEAVDVGEITVRPTAQP